MRISTSFFQQRGLDNMLEAQARLSDLQNNISSGKRINKPSDDPAAVSQILRLNQAKALTEQYTRNGDMALNRLGLEESILNAADNTLLRIRELALQANNATLAASDRQAIAQEISQRLDELLGLANTRDLNGEYLFAGSAVNTRPFVKQADGSISYIGDQHAREIQIGPGRTLADSDTGFDVFMDINTGNGVFQAQHNAGNLGTGVIGAGDLVDASAYVADDYTITFVTNSSGNLGYNVIAATGGQIIPTLPQDAINDAPDFSSGAAFGFNGMEFVIDGIPQTGDTFTITPSSKQSMFTGIGDLVAALDSDTSSPAANAHINNVVNQAINSIDRALDKTIEIRTGVGARLNSVESQHELNDTFLFELDKTLSSVQDLDVTAAVVELQSGIVALEASQAAFVRIQNLSLFEFL